MALETSSKIRLHIGKHNGICTIFPEASGTSWKIGEITPLTHAAARFATSAKASGRVYLAAYESGVWRTDDGGQSWRHLDRYPSSYAHSVVAHPADPDIVYVGSEPAALFCSQDGGLSWEECKSFREIPESINWSFHGDRHSHIRDLRVAPNDPHLIYAGIEVGGVVRSKDGGATWMQLNGPDLDVHSLHICTTRPATIYAATAMGPYRSDDGGDGWESIVAGLERKYTVPVLAAPDDHRLVLVGVASNAGRSGAQAYRSIDSGRNWERLNLSTEENMVVVFTWDPLDSNRVYAGTDKGKIYLSLDRGRSWNEAPVDLGTIAVGAMVALPYA